MPSSPAVGLWLEFIAAPTPRNWYRAHNASIVSGYLEHQRLTETESAPERFFMNVALGRVLYTPRGRRCAGRRGRAPPARRRRRVLYTHAVVAAPRLALGLLGPLGRVLADPRLGGAGAFLSLRRVLPAEYPLLLDVESYIADEQRLGRLLDYAIIVPRLQALYEWSAEELDEPRLLDLVHAGNPVYVWPEADRHVWRSAPLPLTGRLLERLTRAR